MDRWLRNPNVVRIIALVLSILLWLVVHMEDRQKAPSVITETNELKEISNVSIETIGLDEEKLALISIEPEQVKLRVRGKTSDLKQINLQKVKVSLNLEGVLKGRQSMTLTPVGFSNRVEVEVIPANVTVSIEQKHTREMPVVIETVGDPAEGLVVGAPIVQPNRVFVTISESAIEELDVIKGQIDVSGAKESVLKQIKLIAYNKQGKVMQAEISPSVVDAEVPVTFPSKKVPLKIQLTGSPAEGFSLDSFEQDPQEVVIYGDEQTLKSLDFYPGAQADITNISADQTLTIDIPNLEGIAEVVPAKVELKLRVVPAEVRTIEQVELAVVGLADSYTANIIAPENGLMNVTLEGSPDVLSQLKAEDIDLIVDVANLQAGTHQVNVSYSLPAFVKVVGEPATVSVQLSEAEQQQTP